MKETILVAYLKQPILDITDSNMGLNRDRNPDSGWGELRHSRISKENNIIEVPLTPELKITLLEDLAYAYGANTLMFRKKLIEFELI